MNKPTYIDKIRAIVGSSIAVIFIYIGGRGYFEDKNGWGWWLFLALIALCIAFVSDDDESETEEDSPKTNT